MFILVYPLNSVDKYGLENSGSTHRHRIVDVLVVESRLPCAIHFVNSLTGLPARFRRRRSQFSSSVRSQREVSIEWCWQMSRRVQKSMWHRRLELAIPWCERWGRPPESRCPARPVGRWRGGKVDVRLLKKLKPWASVPGWTSSLPQLGTRSPET